jgi:septal ring factor EnvC (AmiA/AmiB activator)
VEQREDRMGLQASSHAQDATLFELSFEQCAAKRLQSRQEAEELHAKVFAQWEEIRQLESAVDRLKQLHASAPQQDDLKAVASFPEQVLEGRSWYYPTLHAKVVQPFGFKKVHYVSKGVLLESAGAEVRAIGAGKVLFQGILPGLGLALLVDHGLVATGEGERAKSEKLYSLLGHLESTKVDRGDGVEAAQVVGTMRQQVYLEVRRGSVPFDPLRGDLQWVGN